ncbi:glycoside hydrolase family 28 protein [Myriangium duriaei CBS 260.36]|uniref:galacturonan 1,4-alpha-galacturonidase n=1 Tax=Myriangium duriaei CBS 260.36 TaxID=1168546 RepID=A0A9P4J1N9_9PEZI|nr:glycoside hydrolase family 28 protein [Myriangium duriaei CBS 260.36]
MLFKSILVGLLSASAVLASPASSKVTPSKRPNVQVSPKKPFHPIPAHPSRHKTCVVPSHNDGVTDDSPAILKTLHDCNEGGHVVFPKGNNYLIGTALDLTFLCHIDIDIQGNILFTNDTDYWQKNGFFQVFQNVTTFFQLGGEDVNIYGGGTIDGNGQVWYDLYAKNIYILRPVLFGTIGLHDSTISHLNLRNSPEYYNFVANSTNVVFSDISIQGASKSANPAKNTDGWDTYRSSNIVIQNSVINNGDDCVSFKPNSTSILVQNLSCTGSHGISVGSLGQYKGEYDIVQDVLVYNITLTNVTDGARIKVWPGSAAALSGDLQGGGGSGMVKNIVYDTLTVNNADYAIEVTQCYGQKNVTLCDQYPSSLTISDVTIKNVHGTASAKYKGISGYVRCSSPNVCSAIELDNINVKSLATNGTTDLFTCGNVDQSLLHGITCTTTDLGYN